MSQQYEADRSKQTVIERGDRGVPIAVEADVVVCGGGPAGIAAALAAARENTQVILVERNGFLGGTATAGLMGMFCLPYRLMSGISKEVVDQLLENDAAVEVESLDPFDPEELKHILMDMLEHEQIDVRLYVTGVEPIIFDGTMGGVIVESKSGKQAIPGKVVIGSSDMVPGKSNPVLGTARLKLIWLQQNPKRPLSAA